jgi:chaperonin cofactor prefoldin
MPNPYLSGRIPVELDKQIDEFLARTGETKTQMLIKAVSAYIGAEPPPLKVTGDRRIENLELEVAELKGAVQSLYEKFAAFTSQIENPKVELEPITTCDNICDNNDNKEEIDNFDHTFSDIDNTVDNTDNHVEIEKANISDNVLDNTDNRLEITCPTEVTPAINDDKTFLEIETAEVARLTKLDAKKFTNLRYSFNQKFKKQNQPSLPENEILDSPIKMTPSSGIKIAKIPYDVFYVGQSKEGKHLWNLIPKAVLNQPIQLTLVNDNT